MSWIANYLTAPTVRVQVLDVNGNPLSGSVPVATGPNIASLESTALGDGRALLTWQDVTAGTISFIVLNPNGTPTSPRQDILGQAHDHRSGAAGGGDGLNGWGGLAHVPSLTRPSAQDIKSCGLLNARLVS